MTSAALAHAVPSNRSGTFYITENRNTEEITRRQQYRRTNAPSNAVRTSSCNISGMAGHHPSAWD